VEGLSEVEASRSSHSTIMSPFATPTRRAFGRSGTPGRPPTWWSPYAHPDQTSMGFPSISWSKQSAIGAYCYSAWEISFHLSRPTCWMRSTVPIWMRFMLLKSSISQAISVKTRAAISCYAMSLGLIPPKSRARSTSCVLCYGIITLQSHCRRRSLTGSSGSSEFRHDFRTGR